MFNPDRKPAWFPRQHHVWKQRIGSRESSRTNAARGVPFHLPIPADTGLTGFVMVEQLKSLDYRQRGAKRIGRVTAGFLEDVLDVVRACIEDPNDWP